MIHDIPDWQGRWPSREFLGFEKFDYLPAARQTGWNAVSQFPRLRSQLMDYLYEVGARGSTLPTLQALRMSVPNMTNKRHL